MCAGYCCYGSATEMVITYGHGVERYTLDPSIGMPTDFWSYSFDLFVLLTVILRAVILLINIPFCCLFILVYFILFYFILLSCR